MMRFLKKEEFRPRQLPLSSVRGSFRSLKKEKGGRKQVFGLLFLTLAFSALFWFWGDFRKREEEGKPPAPIEILPTLVKTETAKKEVVAKVLEKTQGLQGEYGFYVYNLVGRWEYGARENEVFTAASLIKLPAILTLYQEAEAGKISLESKYQLKETDKTPGAGSLSLKPAGTVLTYRKLIELMCKQSDNTAFSIVRRILGDERIQETIDGLGMKKTSLFRNETSPSDIGLFFKKLYAEQVVSRVSRDEIIDFLTDTAFEDRIPAGVPEGVKVSHKIGNEVGTFSDAGIVFSSKPFILVIMSKNASEKGAKEVLPKITKAIWEFETK